jgi:hypothetical protein
MSTLFIVAFVWLGIAPLLAVVLGKLFSLFNEEEPGSKVVSIGRTRRP